MKFITIRGQVLALLIMLPCAFFTAQGQSPLFLRSDNQQWNDVQFAIPLSEKIDFTYFGTLRLGRNFSRPVDERIGAGFTFKPNKYITATAAYLHIGMQPRPNRKAFEERVFFPIFVHVPVGKFSLTDRNQFEFRMRRPNGNSNRYRNRLQVDHPVGKKDWRLLVFVADEVFYDWSFNAWVRNRASIGVTKVINKHLTTDFYYLRQNDSHSSPGDLNVLGTAFRFRL